MDDLGYEIFPYQSYMPQYSYLKQSNKSDF